MKALIFDSSTLINLAMNGITGLIEELKKIFPGKFLITQSVRREIIDRPLQIKRFELNALRIKGLLDKGVIEMSESINIKYRKIHEKTMQIINLVNHSFLADTEWMKILHEGEASCLALSILAKEKGIENAVVIDERTARMLGEKPDNLRKLFEKKLHREVSMRGNLQELSKITFLRSSELVYIAYKKRLVKIGNSRLLDALLYATKFKGCSISREEVELLKGM